MSDVNSIPSSHSASPVGDSSYNDKEQVESINGSDGGELLEEEEGREAGVEGLSGPSSASDDFCCAICNQRYKDPRILSCLHVFCLDCLEKHAVDKGFGPTNSTTVECVMCHQETVVGLEGLGSLPCDHVLINMMDMSQIQNKQVVCTSCKAKEKAVARCMDCANFLGANCVTAHQYMRCFENHKVLLFEDLESNYPLHKPLFCGIHPSEHLKFFCLNCQLLICTECMVLEHKQPMHTCEKLSEVDARAKEQLSCLLAEARTKVRYCEDTANMLSANLNELQLQRDNAKGFIEETFQTYKVIMEKYKDEAIEKLKVVHSRHEFAVMDMCQYVGKMLERVEDACNFTDRLLANGNSPEILLLKRHVTSQLESLINNCPQVEVIARLDFITDMHKFEEAVKNTFGFMTINDTFKENHTLHHSQSPFDEDMMLSGNLHTGDGGHPLLSSESGLGHSIMGEAGDYLGVGPLSPLSLSGAAGLSGISIGSMANSYNGLGNMAVASAALLERSASRAAYSPAMSDSGISVDALSNGSNATLNGANMQAAVAEMAKGLGFSQTGGLGNLSNLLNLSQVMGNRMMTPTTPDASDFSSFLGALNPPTTRSGTPQLSEIGNLLQVSAPGAMPSLAGLASASGILQPSESELLQQLRLADLDLESLGLSAEALAQTTGQPIGSLMTNRSRNAMQIRCKFGQLGPGKGQFNSPHGFCLGLEEDIVVADTNNHRIQVFEKTGEFKYQFGIPGREEGQLWYPRKVAVIRVSGKYVVCDRGNERSRMQIFTKNGHFIKKIAIRYIDIVAGLAINQAGHIVAVDSVSPTVFVISEPGELVKWFDCSDYMREPSDVAVNGREYFICDFKGHCVVVFNEEGSFLRRIGCENITNFPNGIDISDAGDVLIGDSHGNRFHVAVFQRDGSLIGEFECPYVKVSRCCGLKITSEGYVVTLAKNNHHVLVLNTLYIT